MSKQQPYEFLVRWDANGKLAGAHVQWMLDSGALSEAEPVEITKGKSPSAFPLADILSQIQTDALASCAELRAELDRVTKRIDEACENEKKAKEKADASFAALVKMEKQLIAAERREREHPGVPA
jgi:uncharacterized membrane protein